MAKIVPITPVKTYITKQEICARYRMSVRTLERLIATGGFPKPLRFETGRNGLLRWNLAIVEAWENEQALQGAAV